MSDLHNRLLALLGLLAATVGGYLIYWYAQSPVGPGLYPARLGGTIVTDEREPVFRLPLIWIRPNPWAEHPPGLTQLSLVGEQGEDGPMLHGQFGPRVTWPDRALPPWRQPRALQGYLEVPFPADGFTATGVRWQIEGEAEALYRTGPVNLIWAGQERSSLTISGGTPQRRYPYDEPGKRPDDTVIEGHYLFLEGHGRIVAIIPSLAGSEPPTEGLRWRLGQEEWGLTQRYYEKPEYQPLSLPWDFAGRATLFLPLTPEANERMKDTYYYFGPALVVEADGKQRIIPSGYREYGLRSDRTWRHWVPYFIYEAE